MNGIHRPDPKFVGNLERELRSTIRRQGRFDNGPSARANVIRTHRWATGLVALIAMCIGSAATFAVAQRLRAQAADLIIAKSEAHLEFANARLQLFVEERVSMGKLLPCDGWRPGATGELTGAWHAISRDRGGGHLRRSRQPVGVGICPGGPAGIWPA